MLPLRGGQWARGIVLQREKMVHRRATVREFSHVNSDPVARLDLEHPLISFAHEVLEGHLQACEDEARLK